MPRDVRFSMIYVRIASLTDVFYPIAEGTKLTHTGHTGRHHSELIQLVQQRLGFLQIGGVGLLGKPVVGGGEEVGANLDQRCRLLDTTSYFTFQLAEAAVPRELFREILRLIDGLRPAPLPP